MEFLSLLLTCIAGGGRVTFAAIREPSTSGEKTLFAQFPAPEKSQESTNLLPNRFPLVSSLAAKRKTIFLPYPVGALSRCQVWSKINESGYKSLLIVLNNFEVEKHKLTDLRTVY